MAYIKHDDDWWEVETAWVEQRAEMPPTERLKGFYSQSTFVSYVHMQMIHCGVNGPAACAERLRAVYQRIMHPAQETS